MSLFFPVVSMLMAVINDFFFLLIIFFFQEVGYQHGKTVFNVWCRSGVLDKMLKDRQETCKSKTDVSAQGNALCSWSCSGLGQGTVTVLRLGHSSGLWISWQGSSSWF